MSEQKKGGCLKVLGVFIVVNVLISGVVGAAAFILWKKNGSPSIAELKARIASRGEDQDAGDGAGYELGFEEVVAKRPVVSSVPIQAGADTYARYTTRKDVLTLVNYYSDT